MSPLSRSNLGLFSFKIVRLKRPDKLLRPFFAGWKLLRRNYSADRVITPREFTVFRAVEITPRGFRTIFYKLKILRGNCPAARVTTPREFSPFRHKMPLMAPFYNPTPVATRPGKRWQTAFPGRGVSSCACVDNAWFGRQFFPMGPGGPRGCGTGVGVGKSGSHCNHGGRRTPFPIES